MVSADLQISRPAPPAIPVTVVASALGVAFVVFLVGRATLMPDVGIWDTAEAQTVPPLLGTMHPTGFPAYVILGWLWTVALGALGSPAFLMNLLSAALIAVAAGAAVVLGWLLTRRLALGVATGFGFAAVPLVWGLSTRADVHALHVALVALRRGALGAWAPRGRAGAATADRWLLGAAAILGVALADHRLVVLLVPGIAAFVLLVEPDILRRGRFVARALGLVVVVAAAFYVELPLRAGPFRAELVYGHPETLIGFLYVTLGTQFGGTIGGALTDLGGRLDQLQHLATGQLGPLWGAAILGAIVTARRRPAYAVLSVSGFVLTALFAAGYENADIERYYAVPALFAWTWLAIGVDGLARWSMAVAAARGLRRSWAVRAEVATGIALAALLLVPTALALPSRWTSVDASGDVNARRWLDATLETLPLNAVVISWWSYSTPLWYGQLVEGRRPDIWVVDDRTRLDEGLGEVTDVIDANLGRRPVFVIRVRPADLAALTARYRLTPMNIPGGGGLSRVDARTTAR
jgi:hypothetical protein